MSVLKPVIFLKISGKDFHSGTTPGQKGTPIISFHFQETDGTQEANKKKKGKRDELKFTFLDFDPVSRTYYSDDSIFKIGALVTFQFGFVDGVTGRSKLSKNRMMKIVDIITNFPEGAEICTITCHDHSRDLNKKTADILRPKNNRDKKEDKEYRLIEVVSEVAKENGFELEARDFNLLNKKQAGGWTQKKQTGMQFLQDLASQYGANVWVENKKLFFETIKPAIDSPPWGRLYRSIDANFLNATTQQALLITFTPKVNLEKVLADAEAADVDTAKNAPVKGTSNKTSTPMTDVSNTGQSGAVSVETEKPNETTSHKSNATPISSKSGSDQMAGQQQLGAESAITASGKTLGHPLLVPKRTVRVAGRISKRWSKIKWYIKSVTHIIDSSGYFCDVDMTSPPNVGGSDANKADTNKNSRYISQVYADVSKTGVASNVHTEVTDTQTGKTVIKRAPNGGTGQPVTPVTPPKK